MTTLHRIRDFWAERFASLSFMIFISNIQIGMDTNVPGFDELEWEATPNGRVFASNVVVTCEGFFNEPHTDFDHTRYAFGFNCLIDRVTGKLHEADGPLNKGKIVGCMFIMKDFDIVVDYDGCDGMYESIWDTTVSFWEHS
jgi:hypothetical protein